MANITNLSRIAAKVAQERNQSTDSEPQREKSYNPNLNNHAVNPGLEAFFLFDKTGENVLDEEVNDEAEMLDAAKGKFDAEKVVTGYKHNGQWVEIDNSRCVIRTDKVGQDAVLVVGVSKEFNTMSYADRIKVPEVGYKEEGKDLKVKTLVGAIDLNIFNGFNFVGNTLTLQHTPGGGNVARDFLQNFGMESVRNIDLQTENILPLREALVPGACSVWQNGRSMTMDWPFAIVRPVSHDPEREIVCSLTFNTGMDGTVADRWWLKMTDMKSRVIVVFTKAENFAPIIKTNTVAIKRDAKDRTGIMENAFKEALFAAVKFTRLIEILSNVAPEKDDSIVEFISEVFDINVGAKGQGKRDYTVFSKVLSTCLSSEYELSEDAQSWWIIWVGICAYLLGERQVNNLELPEQKKEKLLYRQEVEEDDTIVVGWEHLMDAAKITPAQRVLMGKVTASTKVSVNG